MLLHILYLIGITAEAMTGALAAIGADDGIAQDARAAYERSKQEEIDRYTLIFSELPS